MLVVQDNGCGMAVLPPRPTGMIDRKFLDGIDLRWGSIDATLAMIEKIAARDGVGRLAAKGVAGSKAQGTRAGSAGSPASCAASATRSK